MGDYNGVKKLISHLIGFYFKDLKNFVKDPVTTNRYLQMYNESPESLINFWKTDAECFLCFLFGSTRAKKIMIQIVSPMIKEAQIVLQNYTVQREN